MPGNTIGEKYKVTTFGESHGELIGCLIDGCPSGLKIDVEGIQYDLDRRKPGQSQVTTQRKEKDSVKITAGLMNGITTGAPIEMIIYNQEADSSKYENIKDKFRPGHADHTYFIKYGLRDWRGGGRSSARETAARVMAGAVAKQILEECVGTNIRGYTVNVGGIEAQGINYDFIEQNILRCCDPNKFEEMLAKVEEAKKNNDSIGGAVRVEALHVPKGLGEPVFDKLNADLMKSLGSIGAVKAIGIGKGREVESMLGSDYNDQMNALGDVIRYESNHAGGIIGGISNGEDIVARLSVKPTPTRKGVPMMLPTEDGRNEEVIIEGKHDPVIMPRLVPVAEAMMAITLVDHYLRDLSSRLR